MKMQCHTIKYTPEEFVRNGQDAITWIHSLVPFPPTQPTLLIIVDEEALILRESIDQLKEYCNRYSGLVTCVILSS